MFTQQCNELLQMLKDRIPDNYDNRKEGDIDFEDINDHCKTMHKVIQIRDLKTVSHSDMKWLNEIMEINGLTCL